MSPFQVEHASLMSAWNPVTEGAHLSELLKANFIWKLWASKTILGKLVQLMTVWGRDRKKGRDGELWHIEANLTHAFWPFSRWIQVCLWSKWAAWGQRHKGQQQKAMEKKSAECLISQNFACESVICFYYFNFPHDITWSDTIGGDRLSYILHKSFWLIFIQFKLNKYHIQLIAN